MKIKLQDNGAIILNNDFCCDGMAENSKVRFQTHFHEDHMGSFQTSTSYQDIVCTKQTLDLIVSIKNLPSLVYRDNVITTEYDEIKEYNDHKYKFVDSGHMLGSAQIMLEEPSGYRLGYSGDFSMPLDKIIEVDELFIDGTYGDPDAVRMYSQQEVEEQFIEKVSQTRLNKTVYLKAKTGTIIRGLGIISSHIPNLPLLVSNKVAKEIKICNQYGYNISNYYTRKDPEFYNILDTKKYVKAIGSGEIMHGGIGNNEVMITLKAVYGRFKGITEIANNSFIAAISDHADFNGTMDYIKATGAKKIITDTKKNWKTAAKLAQIIKTELNIDARPAEIVQREEL